METLFVTRDALLKQRENTLAIELEGKTHYFPIEKIRHLVLLGESRLNTRLLTLCGKHGVRISIFDYYGYFKGCYEPIDNNPAGKVKLAQASLILNPEKRMSVAREILRGAIHNLKANLLYYQYRGCHELKAVVTEIDKYSHKIAQADTSERLMGIEGNIRQWYYSAWNLSKNSKITDTAHVNLASQK